MKKVLTVLTAMLVITSAFAQLSTSRQMTAKEIIKNHQMAAMSPKVTGNPIWGDTMSYCGDSPFYSSVGNTNTMQIYWAIKLEAAALVGRNTIEAVQFYVPDGDFGIGTYQMTIRQDSATSTALVTESVTTTYADTLTWKTITLSTPMAITQGHDLFICFFGSGMSYPASFISPNNYDNGKYASIDGIEWDLVSNMGVDATWMIRAISDTHIELPPQVSVEGPATVRMNDTAVYTAVSPNANSYTWNVTADYTSISGNTITVVWESAGSMTVEVDATNAAGTSTASMYVDVVDCSETIDDFPFTESFENPIPCWTMFSADASNPNELGLSTDEAYMGVSSFVFSSFSSADDYNQYLITPEIELPASGDYMVNFQYYAYAAGDVFSVLASTTTADTSSFTLLTDVTTPTVGEWAEARVALPAGTKYVCINYYGDYAYYLWIDEFTITTLAEPNLSLTGDTLVGTGNTATYTASSTMVNTFQWSVDGAVQSETGAMFSYVFTTPGQHTVEVSATNSVGTTTESLTVEVFNCDGITLPYAPDFSEGLHCWNSRSDMDEGYGWFPSIDMFEEDPVGQVLSMSASYFLGYMFPADIDNWLISPSITMPAEGSYDLTWKAMTYAGDYPLDHYAAYVITEDGTETMLFEETLAAHNTSFAQRVASIPASVTGNFKVAFRHYDTDGGYVLILDEIKIVNAGTITGIENADGLNIAVYPNPASEMLYISGEGIQQVEMMDMAGRTVMTSTANQLNVSGIASGMYMVRVTTANGTHIEKVAVK